MNHFDPDLVAVEARRSIHATTTYPAAAVPLPATANPLAAIARPAPSLAGYDQLLDSKPALKAATA